MNQKEREKLKEKVMDMVVTGYTYRQIARSLNIGLKTVNRYVDDIKQQKIKEMHQTAEKQIAAMEIEKEKRLKRIWSMALDQSLKPADRARAIQLLQNEETLAIKRKQLVGLLPNEAPLVAIQNNTKNEVTITDSIKKNFPELLEKFSNNKTKLIKNGSK